MKLLQTNELIVEEAIMVKIFNLGNGARQQGKKSKLAELDAFLCDDAE